MKRDCDGVFKRLYVYKIWATAMSSQKAVIYANGVVLSVQPGIDCDLRVITEIRAAPCKDIKKIYGEEWPDHWNEYVDYSKKQTGTETYHEYVKNEAGDTIGVIACLADGEEVKTKWFDKWDLLYKNLPE
jgi:hypothetical protein